MNRSTIDLWVGIFVTIGLGAIVFLALKVGNLDFARLEAELPDRGELRQHRRPQAARAGQGGGRDRRPRRVGDARPEDATRRIVTLKVDNGYQFSKDTIAAILTSGLLGEVYIGLEAGGDPVMLADGGRIGKTQSAIVLEKLISQFLFDKASSGAAK